MGVIIVSTIQYLYFSDVKANKNNPKTQDKKKMEKPTTGKGKNSLMYFINKVVSVTTNQIWFVFEYIFAFISGEKMPKADSNKP